MTNQLIHQRCLKFQLVQTQLQMILTKDNKYSWLDPEDKRRHMTDAEILRQKLNLEDSVLGEKGKEEFLTKTDDFHDVFSLRDERGTCPLIEVHLKLKDKSPCFV